MSKKKTKKAKSEVKTVAEEVLVQPQSEVVNVSPPSLHDLCGQLSDPGRLSILHAIRNGPKSVGEIATECNVRHPSASHNLGLMRFRGMVTPTKNGKSTSYALGNNATADADGMTFICADGISLRVTGI